VRQRPRRLACAAAFLHGGCDDVDACAIGTGLSARSQTHDRCRLHQTRAISHAIRSMLHASASLPTWARHIRSNSPPRHQSSATEPSSAIFPASSTIMRSKLVSVDSLCATEMTVRSAMTSTIPSRIRASDSVSSAEVGSSKTIIGASFKKARAMPTRWRCPPDSRTRLVDRVCGVPGRRHRPYTFRPLRPRMSQRDC
jgi:hypothetical protein